LNSSIDEIAFKLPKIAEYPIWRLLFDTTVDDVQVSALAAGSPTSAPPRSVLAYAGSAG
jgi:glycogen operon protein